MPSPHITRRDLMKAGALALGAAAVGGALPNRTVRAAEATESGVAKVYFCKTINPENLLKIYDKIGGQITGKTAVKVHTGEPGAPNLPPRELARALIERIPNSTIVECNVLYPGPRFKTETHRRLLEENGWTFSPVDILDEDGDTALPVPGAEAFFERQWGKPGTRDLPFAVGNHLREIYVGSHLLDYDSLVVLTHFKGHPSGGYGGSLKNIAIGCASPRGKRQQHGDGWIKGELFQEHMVEAAKAIVRRFAPRVAYINLLMNLSIDCDCAGMDAAKPEIPDIGVVAGTDLAAVERASVDMIYKLPDENKKSLIERIESRAGLRQLEFMKIFGMGDGKYEIVEI